MALREWNAGHITCHTKSEEKSKEKSQESSPSTTKHPRSTTATKTRAGVTSNTGFVEPQRNPNPNPKPNP